MIWALYILMAIGVVIFLGPVLIAAPQLDDADAEDDPELASYFAAIDALDHDTSLDDTSREAARLNLKRQLLERRPLNQMASVKPWAVGVSLLAIVGIGGAVYASQGNPNAADMTAQGPAVLQPGQALAQAEPPEHESGASLANLVEQLEQRLQGERAEDPNGWLLYARSMMNLNRFENALRAYDRVVVLTENNPDALEERDRARAFIAQRGGIEAPELPAQQMAPRGPTAGDVEAVMQMDESDRQAMIEGMVASLAARLADDPNDPAGWARLLRVRNVLGQAEQRAADIETIKSIFANRPALRDQILQSE